MNNTEIWMNILLQAIEIATQVLNRLDIPAGTYTAADIHRVLKMKHGNYLQKKQLSVFTSGTDDEKYDFRMNYCHTLQCEGIAMTVLTRQIFYNIISYEKFAGVKAKDKHIWVKDCTYKKICACEVEFPTKPIAQGLPSLLSSVNKRNSDCMVFMPTKGKLLGTSSYSYLPFNSECKVESENELPDVAFKFKASLMKQIYGRCLVEYYIDHKDRYSIVVTNEKGWKTSIDNYVSPNDLISITRMIKEQESVEGTILSPYRSERYACDYVPKPKTTEPTTKKTKTSITLEDILDEPNKDKQKKQANVKTVNISPVPTIIMSALNSSTKRRTMKQRERAAMRKIPPFKKKYIEHTVTKLHFSRRKR